MTFGIAMLGAQTSHVDSPGEANGYASAFGRADAYNTQYEQSRLQRIYPTDDWNCHECLGHGYALALDRARTRLEPEAGTESRLQLME